MTRYRKFVTEVTARQRQSLASQTLCSADKVFKAIFAILHCPEILRL